MFRGTLQPLLGLVPAALIFALVHISYYKKPIVLVETFIQGLVLGVLFQITGSIWVTTVAHAAFNTLQTYNIYEQEVRADIIIDKLDKIIISLDQIKNNQYMIYQELRTINQNLDRLNKTVSEISDTVKSIDKTTREIEYNISNVSIKIDFR